MKVVREVSLFFFLVFLQFQLNSVHGSVTLNLNYERGSSFGTAGRLVKKHERMPLLSTEFGSISTVDIDDGTGRHNYHLQFITLEPNSLFLPVLLHADMVFFVHTGSGRLSWIDIDKDEVKRIELQRGDLYRLKSGALFYLHSSLEPERPRLRIISIFANSENDDNELQLQDPSIGPYSSINDLVRGFDTKVLQAAFQVPEEVVEEITSATDMPAIVHAETGKKKSNFWDENALFLNAFISIKRYNKVAAYENKKKDIKTFNFLKEKPDVKNCNGWSTVVTKHELHALEGSHIGAFMVNLTKGSMMGPHWNPKATEVSVVLDGEAMVRVVCPSTLTSKDCKNTRFRVEEGDVFVVPRFHPMAQTAFNDNSLAFMGFSSTTKKNHPQFLVGKASVLQTLNRFILAASFSVSNATIDKLLAAQKQSIILDCTNCAEEEEMLMEKEIEDVRWEEEEEERKREEEKQRKREEEKQRQQEEEERRREEEERRRKEEERKRQEEEEERRRQEEEEEKRRQEEEEEEEEEERRRKEEEEKEKQEEEAKRREEEERRRREQEKEIEREAEEARRMEEERSRREEEKRSGAEEERQREKEGRRREEEERQQQEEERREQEEQRRQEEAREREEQRQQEQEQEKQRQREEAMERAEQERQRQQEEAMERAEQERQRQQEEAMERAEEEEQQRQWEEARERAEERRREERQRQEEEAMERAEQRRRKEAWQRQREEAMERAEQRRRKEEWQRQQEEARERAEQRRRHERERREASEEEETEAAAARREERERQEDEAARRRGMEFNMEQRHQETKMFGEMGKGKGHIIRSSKFARSL